MKKCVLPPTSKKASLNTCGKVNRKIRRATISCIDQYKDGSPDLLSDKIHKLEHEWDTERVLETTAASAVLLGSILAFQKKKCCYSCLTGTVGSFLLLHALQGWCPTLPIIRCMGVRTAEEIFNEKTVFKMVRGDFSGNTGEAERMLDIAEK